MSLKAASMRFALTVQNPSAGVDATGQPSREWTNGSTVRAAIETMQGTESPYAGGQQAACSHKITVRAWAHGITTGSRLKFDRGNGAAIRYFEVVSITDPTEIKHYQLVLAKEVVA